MCGRNPQNSGELSSDKYCLVDLRKASEDNAKHNNYNRLIHYAWRYLR